MTRNLETETIGSRIDPVGDIDGIAFGLTSSFPSVPPHRAFGDGVGPIGDVDSKPSPLVVNARNSDWWTSRGYRLAPPDEDEDDEMSRLMAELTLEPVKWTYVLTSIDGVKTFRGKQYIVYSVTQDVISNLLVVHSRTAQPSQATTSKVSNLIMEMWI